MSSRRSMFAILAAVGALALAGASTASAKDGYGPVTGVICEGPEGHTGGSANGECSAPADVAIDQASGEVYVADAGNNRVQVFSKTGEYLFQFNGGPEHTFSAPESVAVDQLNGDVYVADTGNNVVDKLTASGEYICTLAGFGRGCQTTVSEPPGFEVPISVAVDSTHGPASGDVYVSDREHKIIDVFTESGGDVSQFEAGARPWTIAVNSEGDVFVALAGAGRIEKYAPAGAAVINGYLVYEGGRSVGVDSTEDNRIFVGTEKENQPYVIEEVNPSTTGVTGHFGEGSLSMPGIASPGIAVNAETNVVYVADPGNNVVDMFGEVPGPTVLGSCAAEAVSATSATLRGEVNPEGVESEYSFRYGLLGAAGGVFFTFETPFERVDGGALVKTGEPVKSELSELTPGTEYDCEVFAKNSFGLSEKGTVGVFETPPLPPVVEEEAPFASEVGSEGATLNGEVNPGNGDTAYHFEYGTEAGRYSGQLPNIPIGNGFETLPVEEAIPAGALRPDTKYHFALVAENQATAQGGPVVGADETFTTAPAYTPPSYPSGNPPPATGGPPLSTLAPGAVLAAPPAAASITVTPIAFPKETGGIVPGGGGKKATTGKQKRAQALAQCRRLRARARRATCERRAQRRYGARKAGARR